MKQQTIASGGLQYVQQMTAQPESADIYSSGYDSTGNRTDTSGITLLDSSIYVSSGETFGSITVGSGGWMAVLEGGKVNGLTVCAGGIAVIASGAEVARLNWTPCVGSVYVEDGARISYAGNHGGIYFGYNNKVISHTTTMSGVRVGKVNDAVMYIMNCGSATGTTVYNRLYVYMGGIADNTAVSSGSMSVFSGGTANHTVLTGGMMLIASSGTANNTAVKSYSYLSVAAGGTANKTYVGDGEFRQSVRMYVAGTANNTTVNSTGSMFISSGGIANDTLVKDNGVLYISSGGTANNTLLSGAYLDNRAVAILSGGTANNTITNRWGDMHISSGGIAANTSVSGGSMFISSGGVCSGTSVISGGNIFVSGGGQALDTVIFRGGGLFICSGGVAGNTYAEASYIHISSGGTHRGKLFIYPGMYVSAYRGAVIDFTLAGRQAGDEYLINSLCSIIGTPSYTVTVSETQNSGIYKLAKGAAGFSGSITVGDNSVSYGNITVNGTALQYNGTFYSAALHDDELTFSIVKGLPVLSGSQNGISVSNTPDMIKTFEFSRDDFNHSLQIETRENTLDFFGLPTAEYQWRITAADGENFVNGKDIVSILPEVPQKHLSDADGNMDIFFASAIGQWETGFLAERQGSSDSMTGTKEQISISGKNRFADIFCGSEDKNILALTDDHSGDALFIDDIYTDFGNDSARICQIDEIRAGAGDDVIDLTSFRYACEGSSIRIYGGIGDDTVWGGTLNNILFGDAGNDRIAGGSGNDYIIGGIDNDSLHGGGGEDIFCFGGNWGNDTVEQLADGSVTLWFESGSASNWNASTLTYTDGTNTVKVSGVDTVTLKFGTDASLPDGCFADAASEKIFEDKNSGMLA